MNEIVVVMMFLIIFTLIIRKNETRLEKELYELDDLKENILHNIKDIDK